MPMFALCDCNSFYCSCESVFQPRLWKVPVVVLSNNDGCVIALNAHAKACGIKMSVPAHLSREQFGQHRVEVFSSNYALYGDMSRRVMRVLADHASAIEIYSIDEAFLSLDGMDGTDLALHARYIRETVGQWTGIPIGVGVAETKTLAKLANKHAKRSGTGIYVLDHRTPEARELLDRWPCADVWGIAQALAGRLLALGIQTAGDLARAEPTVIRRKLGVVGERLALELRGVSCSGIEESEEPRQNICASRSFGRPVTELQELREAVATHAWRIGEKLRQQGLAASAMCVFLTTNRFKPDLPQYTPQAGRELLVPTSFAPELVGECQRILAAIFKPGYGYTKAGVFGLGLVPDDDAQGSLFRPADPEAEGKRRRLMDAVDKINTAHGRGTMRTATAGFDHRWQMRRDRKSPCYTTRLSDVPLVRLD